MDMTQAATIISAGSTEGSGEEETAWTPTPISFDWSFMMWKDTEQCPAGAVIHATTVLC